MPSSHTTSAAEAQRRLESLTNGPKLGQAGLKSLPIP